jgi:hypothetical protein
MVIETNKFQVKANMWIFFAIAIDTRVKSHMLFINGETQNLRRSTEGNKKHRRHSTFLGRGSSEDKYHFLGEMAHLNIFPFVLDRGEVKNMCKECMCNFLVNQLETVQSE